MDENPIVVNGEPTIPQGSEPAKVADNGTLPGSKTDPALLLKSLQDEREKRQRVEDALRAKEEEIVRLSTQTHSEDVFSDEGKALDSKINTLTARLKQIEEEKELDRIIQKYPVLKDAKDDLIQYRSAEHPNAKIESVAKLFMSERGLLESKRQGLEEPTGGPRVPMSSGMTSEEVKHLRETNYAKYMQLLKNGDIKIN